ncbi:MAG: Gfo/Idh/MocA family oxidoreductase [bacterium]|nr:Gfo/Idh/MocA family oxidoreductase [bacterium]
MEKIRVGFIGAGMIGPIHMENLSRIPNIEIAALASRNQEFADKNTARLGIPKAYGEWQDLVTDPEIDIVHITCPNRLHYPIAKACIEAGKHVVCDKPLTMDTTEARDLVMMAKEANVLNAVTFNMGFYPMVQEARKMVAAGDIGDFRVAYGRYCQDWLAKDTDYNWRVEAEHSGKSRVVADIGSHWMQMVQMVSGKRITSVYGDATIFIPVRKKPLIDIPTFSKVELKPGEYEEINVDTEDHATVMFKFEDGAKGVMIVFQLNPGRKNRIEWEICGSEKSLSWNGEEANQLWVGSRTEPNRLLMKDGSLMHPDAAKYASYPGGLLEGYGESWKNIFVEIYEYLKTDGLKKGTQPPFPTFKEGYKIQMIIDGILESIESNQWVDIDWEAFDSL